jgi:hypothetical protein
VAATPTNADSHFRQGQALLAKAMVDTQSGTLFLPARCAEVFQNCLVLAPDGQYAKSAKDILDLAGVPIKSH